MVEVRGGSGQHSTGFVCSGVDVRLQEGTV